LANGEVRRSDAKFHKALVSLFAHDGDTRVHVTDMLAKDLQQVNLCKSGSMIVATTHKGITPCVFPWKEHTQIQKEDAKQKQYDSATHHSMDDVWKMDLELQLILPENFDGLTRGFNNYAALLEKVIGGDYAHWARVKVLNKVLESKRSALEPIIDTKKALILLWNVHVDSHTYFFEAMKWQEGDPFPEFSLRTTVMNLRDERICQKDTMLLETIPKKYAPSIAVNMGVESPSPGNNPTRAKKKQTQRNPKMAEAFKPIIGKLKTKNSAVCYDMLNATGAAGCDYKDLRVGQAGTCIDYGVFGFCPNKECEYNHRTMNPSTKRAADIVKNLENGLAAL
jgi:hypothetical protein